MSDAIDYKATKVIRQWKHTAPLLGCRYDPSGRYVFATAMDHTICRWDLAEDQHATFAGHDSWLRGIGFSSDGAVMYSAGYDGRLCFWDAVAQPNGDKPFEPVRTIDAHDGWIRWLAVSPDGGLIATAGNDLKVRLWNSETGQQVNSLDQHLAHIYSLMFHPDGKFLLSGDLAGVVHQWEIASGKLLRSLDAKPLHTYHGGQQVDYGGVRCMALSADGVELALGGLHKATNPFAGVQEPLVLVLNWESGEQIRTHEATEVPRGIVWRLDFQSDGTLVGGIGGDAGFLVFWKQDKMDFHKLKLPSPVQDFDRDAAAAQIATVHYDGHIRVVALGGNAS